MTFNFNSGNTSTLKNDDNYDSNESTASAPGAGVEIVARTDNKPTLVEVDTEAGTGTALWLQDVFSGVELSFGSRSRRNGAEESGEDDEECSSSSTLQAGGGRGISSSFFGSISSSSCIAHVKNKKRIMFSVLMGLFVLAVAMGSAKVAKNKRMIRSSEVLNIAGAKTPKSSKAPKTAVPSLVPSSSPSMSPSLIPSSSPSDKPTSNPSVSITPSVKPSNQPSSIPSETPSTTPSSTPSSIPSLSFRPSSMPSDVPSASSQPSSSPSRAPSTIPSSAPTNIPSLSSRPSAMPSDLPSLSSQPSSNPSQSPSSIPSSAPTNIPSLSSRPSATPSDVPSLSSQPSSNPSYSPSSIPSSAPTNIPSLSSNPSAMPSDLPSLSSQPSSNPSQSPSSIPSSAPSDTPSLSSNPSLSAQPSTPVTVTVTVGVYNQPNLNGQLGKGFCSTETDNILSIILHFKENDAAFASFQTSTSIQSFGDSDLESKLAGMDVFVMPDIEDFDRDGLEAKLAGWGTPSQTILSNYVAGGGVLLVTGRTDYGNADFLNDIFVGWDLGGYPEDTCSSPVMKNAANTAGTAFDDSPTILSCPPRFSTPINCNSVDCTVMYGDESEAYVVVIEQGDGLVIFIALDFYSAGYQVNGFHSNCVRRLNPWVVSTFKSTLLLAAAGSV